MIFTPIAVVIALVCLSVAPIAIVADVFAELWTKVIMKTELKTDRDYLTKNAPYLEYSDTEIKMLDIGEALLISEPKIRFAVPVKIIHFPEYLGKQKKPDYNLPSSKTLESMAENLVRLRKAKE